MLFFFKQKTAYELRISDRSSDVCSSDLAAALHLDHHRIAAAVAELLLHLASLDRPLEAERLAGQSRLVLFVTHRKPSFLQNASEAAEPASAVPVFSSPTSEGACGSESRLAASLLHPVKNCQRLKCARTRRSEEHTSELQ